MNAYFVIAVASGHYYYIRPADQIVSNWQFPLATGDETSGAKTTPGSDRDWSTARFDFSKGTNGTSVAEA